MFASGSRRAFRLRGARKKKAVHETLDLNSDMVFCFCPEPSPGDMFFDLEGDPFIGRGGREYLFGFVVR